MTDDHDEKTHRYEEALKLCFDGCKHMSILSTAAAGILVAIYREAVIDSFLLVLALIMLTVSILISLVGLIVPTMRFIVGGGWHDPFLLMFFSIDTFVLGIVGVIAEALKLPLWVGIVVGVVLGIAILIILNPLLSTSAEE